MLQNSLFLKYVLNEFIRNETLQFSPFNYLLLLLCPSTELSKPEAGKKNINPTSIPKPNKAFSYNINARVVLSFVERFSFIDTKQNWSSFKKYIILLKL